MATEHPESITYYLLSIIYYLLSIIYYLSYHIIAPSMRWKKPGCSSLQCCMASESALVSTSCGWRMRPSRIFTVMFSSSSEVALSIPAWFSTRCPSQASVRAVSIFRVISSIPQR